MRIDCKSFSRGVRRHSGSAQLGYSFYDTISSTNRTDFAVRAMIGWAVTRDSYKKVVGNNKKNSK